MIPDDLQRGDLLRVEWVDIFEDVTADPAGAELAHRVSYGVFWERRVSKLGPPCLITTTTLDKGETNQSGYCIYPEACVLKLSVIRRVRRKKKEKIG